MSLPSEQPPVPLAIVGIGCLFPRAGGPGAFWANIRKGIDCISEVPPTHWRPEDFFAADPKSPDMTYATRGGFLEPVDFNPLEFGIAPNDLEAIDTSQLLGLLAARQALRDAGILDLSGKFNESVDKNRISVVLGVTGTLELVIPLGARLGHPRWRAAMLEAGVDEQTTDRIVERIGESYVPWQEQSFPGLLGNVVAGRIANRLDLGGTNCVVDAACASSLSAVHLAGLELAAGRADIAVTGGVDTFNDIFMFMCFSKTPALSPTGDARPFDMNGDGTILGEGLGVVVLKRLADARRDGDKVYAVIRSVGSSSDGKGNAIYAPSASGQIKAIRNAYRLAGVSPATIELVEGHGTGTKVGDGVEVSALVEVYSEGESRVGQCAIGSVKSQIGHTKAAAGAAGLIKATLALHHKVLPPTAKVRQPIETLATESSPLYVNIEKRPWLPHPDHPRRAALSAFGFGGSNFHCVLEESSPQKSEIDWDGDIEILAFSGKDEKAILRGLDTVPPSGSWQDFRSFAATTRAKFHTSDPVRLLAVVQPTTDRNKQVASARNLLSQSTERSIHTPDGLYFGRGPAEGKLAVLFPGQGSQYVGMLRDLACTFPAMLEILEDANRLFSDTIGDEHNQRLSDLIYPPSVFSQDARTRQDLILRETPVAQPALGAVCIGGLKILEGLGVVPDAYAGHSYGELPALCAAGVFDEPSLHKLSRLRGTLMASFRNGDAGAMLAVHEQLEAVESLISEERLDLTVANRNAPSQFVISGASAEVDRASATLTSRGVRNTRLPVAAAFHSPLVARAREPFHQALSEVEFHGPRSQVFANTTAEIYPTGGDAIRETLAGQLAAPVDFIGEIRNMVASGVRTFLEVGPGSTLTRLVNSILASEPSASGVDAIALDASGGRRSGCYDLACVLARLAARGHQVDLNLWQQGGMTEIPLTGGPKPGLTVPLCGANYVRPRTKERSPSTNGTKKSATKPAINNIPSSPVQPAVVLPAGAEPSSFLKEKTVNRDSEPKTPSDPASIQHALQLTQQSLAAFEKLQEQTAQLHRQFLTQQEAAQQTLHRLVEQQQALLFGGAMPLPSAPPPVEPSAPIQSTPVPATLPVSPTPSSVMTPLPVSPIPPTSTPVLSGSTPTPATLLMLTRANMEKIVLSVVAEKTGYPAEMLGLDMALDADLGIDSIKRVEILSTLQEKLPEAPPVKPEHLGTIHTLRDVMDLLIQERVATKPEISIEAPPKSPDSSRKSIEQTLLEVIAEKTGYPVDMLTPDMALDSDLGIDSIKRVEILSALQEKLPDAPAVKPEQLATLHTLRDICLFLDLGHSLEATESPTRLSDSAPSSNTLGTLQEIVLGVVADKTGYPVNMLGLDMALDSDLGIDSIKRVEILSALQDKLPEAPAVTPERLGSIHTLRDVITFLSVPRTSPVTRLSSPSIEKSEFNTVAESSLIVFRPSEFDGGRAAKAANKDSVELFHPPPAGEPAPPVGIRVERSILLKKPIFAGEMRTEIIPASSSIIWVVAEPGPLTKGILQQLDSRGHRVESFRWNATPIDIPTGLAGLVLVTPAGRLPDDFPLRAFRWVRQVSSTLKAALKGNAILATVTQLDGAFGLDNPSEETDPASGALAGILKTAALEWPDVACKAFDVHPAYAQFAAGPLVEELFLAGPLEVGLSSEGRITLDLTARPLPDHIPTSLPLGKEDVILVTGGARGVTAEVVTALAQATSASFLLLGRTPLPESESYWLAGLTDEAEIKRAVLTHMPEGTPPKTIEKHFRKIMAVREVQKNLKLMNATGAKVFYRSLDVQGPDAVAEALNHWRTEVGPITGLIHGAGVLADRRIEDLADEQFDFVYTTKVQGLRNLLKAVGNDPLKVMLLFSSSTARFGRVGQVAYAAANEALNKIAQRHARQRPGCKVVAMNWGPWDGGMVTPSLRKVFEQEGVAVIPTEAGADAVLRELASPERTAEVCIIARPVEAGQTPPPSELFSTPLTDGMSVTFEHTVSLSEYPILRSHIIEGQAVVPVVMHLEWLAHAALHGNPGYLFHGVDDLRILKGIQVQELTPAAIRALAGKPFRRGKEIIVPVEIRGRNSRREFVHSRASVVLTDILPPPELAGPLPSTQPYRYSPRDAYRQFLFHGPALEAIERLEGCGELGFVGSARPAPSPSEWIAHPLRGSWLANPLILDGAFQMKILWCFANRGAGCLPCRVGSYRQYRRSFGPQPLRVIIRIVKNLKELPTADADFVDGAGKLVARLTDFESVVDPSLGAAFRRNQLPQLTMK